jgi:hypothetical protein
MHNHVVLSLNCLKICSFQLRKSSGYKTYFDLNRKRSNFSASERTINCHLVVLLLDDELHVARVLRPVSHGPLQRPEVGVKDVEVVFAESGNGLFLRKSAAAVLDWGEDGGGHVIVVR